MRKKKMWKQLLAIVVAFALFVTAQMPSQLISASTTNSYDFSKMSYDSGWSCSYSISSGKATISYSKLYGEARFSLPETLDMSLCTSVSFKVASTGGNIAFKLYNTAGDEVAVRYNYNASGTCSFVPDTSDKVNMIGIMSQADDAITATITNVSFVMEEGTTTTTAPIQTGSTLLNTYATVLNYTGSCVTPNQLSNSNTLAVVKSQYNSVTMENEMKPDAVLNSNCLSISDAKALGYYIPSGYTESTVPRLNFSNVDKVMQICYENGLKLRAHTLVWHSQTPDWFFRSGYSSGGSYVSQSVMDARMEFYVKSVMSHVYDSQYGSVVYAWDVVNEYFHASNSGWQTIYGSVSSLGAKPSFVKKAFQFAYECLEDYGLTNSVSLFYNDYNTYLVSDDIITMINWINAEKKICAGVGMQSHLATSYPSVSLYRNTILQFANEGFEIQITELDVTCSNLDTQAQYYYDLMTAILAMKKAGANITGVTWWGLYDSVSWRSSQNPLLFSSLTTPKAAYTSVLQAYADAGYTTETSPSPSVSVEPSKSPSPSPSASVEPSKSPSPSPSASVVPSESTSPSPSASAGTSPSAVKPVVTLTAQLSGSINLSGSITSAGSEPVDFSKLVIRYKYTRDGNVAQNFWCDSAGLQLNVSPYYVSMAQNVAITFGNGYADITFDTNDTLQTGTGSLNLGIRIAQEDWSSYSGFVDNGFEVYYDGQLIA